MCKYAWISLEILDLAINKYFLIYCILITNKPGLRRSSDHCSLSQDPQTNF
jgi:hypothetical protein